MQRLKRVEFWSIMVAPLIVIFIMACSLVALGAEEPTQSMNVPGLAWFDQPWFTALCGAAISVGLEAFKRSKAGKWLDASALRDMGAVLIASVLFALPHLANGWPAFGYALLGHVLGASTAWSGANGISKAIGESGSTNAPPP